MMTTLGGRNGAVAKRQSGRATASVAPVTPAERGARRREKTRRALLDAAREVIGEKGVDAATIGEIAERADVGFGSFYNHFESKDDLVDALMAEAVAAHRDYIDTVNLRFDKPAELLANATRMTVHMAAVDALWGALVLRLAAGRFDLVAPLSVGLERDIRNGIAGGQFTDANPALLMAVVAGSVFSMMAGCLSGHFDEEDEWAFAESILRQVGVAPAAARTTVKRVRATQPVPISEPETPMRAIR